jgi:hypothetical protein
MKKTLFVMLVLLAGTTASFAQSPPARVVVNENAPIFVQPDTSVQPLRVAKAGSALNVIASDVNPNWYRVEFQDPQFGRRVGYVEKRFVTAIFPESVDLTIPEARPPVAPAFQDRPAAPAFQDRPAPQFSAPRAKLSTPAFETMMGWGLLRTSGGKNLPIGWSGSVATTINPWMSIVGEASGNYTADAASLYGFERFVGYSYKEHTFLGGPKFVGRFAEGRVNPFGQFLAGVEIDNIGVDVLDGLVDDHAKDTYFAIQPGGGVDIGLTDSLAIRMQVDRRTAFFDGGSDSSWRFMPGVVIRTGSKN